ncbi:hypothetical protein QTJ16_004749 [Diplocarpon rosae]|uniref:Uncharacterized protein n=1 Tax=Diplocarpon rosae TaxID=946125 RepID=A0AAD9SXN4_9HELO|nr:hypothetical protein QTJ16_004749 [Diplocarpon rosae]
MQAADFKQESVAGPPLPSVSPKNSESQQKKVQFDPTVLRNGWKMNSRTKKPFQIASAKISTEFNLPSSNLLGSVFQPSLLLGQYSELEEPPIVGQRRPILYSQTVVKNPTQEPIGPTTSRLTKKAFAQTPVKRPASSSPKGDTSSRAAKSARVPPEVPDAPANPAQRSALTPRPARLPTPDVIEINGGMFFSCDCRTCRREFDLNERVCFAKMDAQRRINQSRPAAY